MRPIAASAPSRFPHAALPAARACLLALPARQRWGSALATLTACGLLLAHVQVCQESVARGARLRAEQRGAALPGATAMAAATSPTS